MHTTTTQDYEEIVAGAQAAALDMVLDRVCGSANPDDWGGPDTAPFDMALPWQAYVEAGLDMPAYPRGENGRALVTPADIAAAKAWLGPRFRGASITGMRGGDVLICRIIARDTRFSAFPLGDRYTAQLVVDGALVQAAHARRDRAFFGDGGERGRAGRTLYAVSANADAPGIGYPRRGRAAGGRYEPVALLRLRRPALPALTRAHGFAAMAA